MSVCLLLIAVNSSFKAIANNPQAQSEEMTWTAENSDPRTLEWMVGSPPPPDKIIRFDDNSFAKFPQWRWTVCNFQQLMPTKPVSRELSAVTQLKSKEVSGIDDVTFIPLGAEEPMTWKESLAANFTDGILVMHHGKVVYETYAGCLDPTKRHGAMSMTKSFIGLLGEMLIAEGQLDESKFVRDYIPELTESAFGDATVRQVLDMTTSLDYSEDYSDPNAGVWQHAAAGNPLPKPADYTGPRTYFEFLQTVQKQGEHGDSFAYKTINTDVLGWLISRVTGKPVTEVLSEKIWGKIGADLDAYMSVDSIGTPFAGGGLSAGLRDMARFGQMILNEGMVDDERVLPVSVIESIQGGGDRNSFKDAGYSALENWSYRSMWWITHNDRGAFMARGVHGQALYIDPGADMTIVRFASHPEAKNAVIDPTSLPAYEALANYLMQVDP
ncbi:serine hydrolase [Pleurocapsa sp. PCC 7319]|uniref:serine hydrolase domain-containing protein n=1 Tax=Pleurocapsa sp. PCC 7319 TaxID=118161 RepID=UPI0003657AB9|nr:serine hydrolase [Pleurocapsa sp. PCC 7319]